MKKFLLLLCCISMLIISGCASVPRIADTPSGKPEINIQTTDAELVKATVVNVFTSRGCVLQNDSSYSMLFTKQVDPSKVVLAQLLYGNSYSTVPELELRINIIKGTNEIKVMAFSSISTQMAFGQIRREEINNNADFNYIYTALQEVKRIVESQTKPQ